MMEDHMLKKLTTYAMLGELALALEEEKTRAKPQPQAFLEVGCQLAKPLLTFLNIYNVTGGDPCNGCAYYQNGTCPAYRKLFKEVGNVSTATRDKLLAVGASPTVVKSRIEPVETVREQAQRLGISISEVRRRRKQGES
jgi:hypothetical protein